MRFVWPVGIIFKNLKTLWYSLPHSGEQNKLYTMYVCAIVWCICIRCSALFSYTRSKHTLPVCCWAVVGLLGYCGYILCWCALLAIKPVRIYSYIRYVLLGCSLMKEGIMLMNASGERCRPATSTFSNKFVCGVMRPAFSDAVIIVINIFFFFVMFVWLNSEEMWKPVAFIYFRWELTTRKNIKNSTVECATAYIA